MTQKPKGPTFSKFACNEHHSYFEDSYILKQRLISGSSFRNNNIPLGLVIHTREIISSVMEHHLKESLYLIQIKPNLQIFTEHLASARRTKMGNIWSLPFRHQQESDRERTGWQKA